MQSKSFSQHRCTIFAAMLVLSLVSSQCGRFKDEVDQDKDSEKDPEANDGGASLTDGGGIVQALVLGDSLSTGALTHPDSVVDAQQLWERIQDGEEFELDTALMGDGEGDGEPPVSRIDDGSQADFFAEVASDLKSDLQELIEFPAYSWASQLADLEDSEGVVALAAQNGARASAAESQASAFVANLQDGGVDGVMPGKTFVFFSGNDLCQGNGSLDSVTAAKAYGESIENGVKTLLTNLKAPDGGATVYIIGHLDLAAFFSDGSVFDEKKIEVRGREMSCSDYLKDSEAPTIKDGESLADAGQTQLYHPVEICESMVSMVPGTGLEPAADPSKVKALIDDYRSASRAEAERLNREFEGEGVSVAYVDAVEDLAFDSEDVSNDCFHLSVAGQKKIASAIQEAIE